MIGNDVIDLALARRESNWRRKGYLEKLFTEDERQQIRESKTPEWHVWNFWSRKEAVYKIINRDTGLRGFIPLKIDCHSSPEGHDYCIFNGQNYATNTYSDREVIHTVAAVNNTDFQNIIEVDNITLVTKQGVLPFYEGRPASISHHGRFTKIVALIA